MIRLPAKPPETHPFSAWPVDVPELPGAYAIWRDDQLVYAGMAGKKWRPDKKNSSHLRQRLRDHANGTRADVFQSYVFERFIGRNLSDAEWIAIENGDRHMNQHAREFIRSALSFSFACDRLGLR